MNKDEVLRLAKLARVGIADSEAESLASEFDAILGYVSEIKGASPAPHEATQDRSVFALRNVMREDANPHEAGIYTEAILAEAPQREGDFIKVKKIL